MIKYGTALDDMSKTAEGHTDAVKIAADNARSALEREDGAELSLSAMVQRTAVETDRFYRKRKD